jgi:tRNA pseudouridine38-40 synthase
VAAGAEDRRLRLLVAYDGAPFSGFARQPGRRTVQGQLEERLSRLARRPVTTVGAGRTDTGVHAYGQVVHADVPGRLDPDRVRAALNGALGPAIVVRAAGWAQPGFDARFSARRRTYLYRVDDSPAPDPLTRTWVLHWRRPLAVPRMAQAAAPLLGEHDFASFCRARGGATTRRRLRAIDVRRVPAAAPGAQGYPSRGPDAAGLVVVRVTADAFCHQMVRSLVGFLLDVGDGRRDPASAAAVLAARDRSRVGTIAPPHGLVLESVGYDDPWPA